MGKCRRVLNTFRIFTLTRVRLIDSDNGFLDFKNDHLRFCFNFFGFNRIMKKAAEKMCFKIPVPRGNINHKKRKFHVSRVLHKKNNYTLIERDTVGIRMKADNALLIARPLRKIKNIPKNRKNHRALSV